MKTPFGLLSILSLALVGFGCQKPSTTPQATTPPPQQETTTSSTTLIDETWDTYSSKTGFSFQFPTKGRLAPQWFIESYKPTDVQIKDNCYIDGNSLRSTSTKLSVNGTSFCVTRFVDPGAGQLYYADNYAFLNGNLVTVITFTKQFSNGSMFDDETCHNKTVINLGTTCEILNEQAYTDLLDTAIKTFKKN